MGRAGDRWRVLLASASVALLGMTAVAGAQEPGGSSSSTTTTTVAPATSTTVPPGGPTVEAVAPDAGARDRPVTAALEPLASVGYREDEVFLSGVATLHGPRGMWGTGGHWSVSDVGTAPYRTRLLVRRPADPATFSGTVYVSWLNVTGGVDTDPEWIRTAAEVVRQGAAWVGVSAQSAGVEGSLGAKAWDAERYGTLAHPGDGASYDIFTDAAEVIRRPGAVDPLGGLTGTRRLIATGQSQSAQRLVTYINVFQPSTKAFDGFLLASRFRGAAPLGRVVVPAGQSTDPDASLYPDPLAALLSGPDVAKLRDDTAVPVLVVLTETEARQDRAITPPDGDAIHTWEIAGSSHSDATITTAVVEKLERDFPSVPLDQLECGDPNSFPTHYALRAATRAVADWVADGTAPDSAPLIERDPASGALVRDDDGNVRGGVRLPEIDVPTAAHTGESDDSGYCGLVGSTKDFDDDDLADRYPTPTAYVEALSAAIDEAVEAGHLLREDAVELLGATPVPGSTATAAAIKSGTSTTSTPGSGSGTDETSASDESASGSPGAAGADTPVRAQSSNRSWMATTGRDLITPFLGGLLLLLNGRVVLTIARQRRRSGA